MMVLPVCTRNVANGVIEGLIVENCLNMFTKVKDIGYPPNMIREHTLMRLMKYWLRMLKWMLKLRQH